MVRVTSRRSRPKQGFGRPGSIALVTATAAILLAASAPVAAATTGYPRRAFLRADGERLQRGAFVSSCWTNADGYGVCADGIVRFDDTGPAVRLGEKMRVRIRKVQRPLRVTLQAYSRVNSNGLVRGEPRELPYRLRRVEMDGQTVAWDAVFRARRHQRYYLFATGEWRRGDVTWAFHFHTAN